MTEARYKQGVKVLKLQARVRRRLLVRDSNFVFARVIMRSGLGHITVESSATLRIAADFGERTFFSAFLTSIGLIGDVRLISIISEIRLCDFRPGRKAANESNSAVTRRSLRAAPGL